MKGFKNLVDSLTVEYEDYHRRYKHELTCEFSTSSEDFEDKVHYLMTKEVTFGRWKLYQCGTCKGYDEDKHWHVEIESSSSLEETHTLINSLKSENHSLKQEAEYVIKDVEGKEFYPRGTLREFVTLFECLVENPEQYDEYVSASFIGDHAYQSTQMTGELCHKRVESIKTLKSLVQLDEDKVLYSQSVDITVDENGKSNWNMVSQVNGGCCAYIHINDFVQQVGKRLRLTVGVLPARVP
jgi:hypothetical protein